MIWGFVLIISLLSYLLALYSPASLVSLLLIAYGGVVQFFPLTVAAFFWKRVTKAGVFAGLISGTLVDDLTIPFLQNHRLIYMPESVD